jgi:hypothetical protein
LRREVEKARANEFEKKAAMEVAQAKLERINAALKSTVRPVLTAQLLASLDRAFALDAQVRDELGQLQKNGAFDGGRGKAIQDLTSQLEAVVDQVEADHAAARVDLLKAKIHTAAGRTGGRKP